ncbi:MAG: hypothetical protein ACOVQM_03605 [Pirellula sp.]
MSVDNGLFSKIYHLYEIQLWLIVHLRYGNADEMRDQKQTNVLPSLFGSFLILVKKVLLLL